MREFEEALDRACYNISILSDQEVWADICKPNNFLLIYSNWEKSETVAILEKRKILKKRKKYWPLEK